MDEPFNPIDEDPIYEREDIQKKAFTKWINNQLANSDPSQTVTDLFQDLRDGVILLRLLEVLTGNEYKREIGKMRVHHIGNVNKVIAVLGEHGIKLLSISSNDIVDGNAKLTLALIWSIIQYWQGKDVLKSAVPNPQQTNVEKFLLSWCQQQTKGYKGVAIKDFTTSWQDGLAFNALIHKFRPDLFDYEDILQHSTARNLEHAFSIAKNVFKIDRYLDVEDVLAEYPDKKSILMYVMCLFQQLPTNNIVIEDKEKDGTPSTTMSTNRRVSSMEKKSPSPQRSETRDPLTFQPLIAYQANMERILQWILQLEEQLDHEEKISSNDLKRVKDQFQKHEDFMISLTKDQNQIGQVLEEGTRLISPSTIQLQIREENEVKEQMKILNRRWESLRSKSLERQSTLHQILMKLQIDQIDSFDQWLIQAEQTISTQLEPMQIDLPGIDRQYRQLAQLQDELVAQQQITESLQNMVIVIDDSTTTTHSKYSSAEIEMKLLSLSERWAKICTFVQTRWIELQEMKIEFEQFETNKDKITKWLIKKEEEINDILSETNLNNTDLLMQQVHSIKKTEIEMTDIHPMILSMDINLNVLIKHYDTKTTNPLQNLNEQISSIKKRWTKLIDDLQQCSERLKKSPIVCTTNVEEKIKPSSNTIEKTITTVVEETIIKKRKISDDFPLKHNFDLSARKFLDWMDSIERILDDKQANNFNTNERQEIIQEIKMKYNSYDEQFKELIQTGVNLIKQMKDANEDSTEHETFLQSFDKRWQALYKQIISCEREIEKILFLSTFNNEFQTLTDARNEYQLWMDSTSQPNSSTEIQVKLKSFQSYSERLANLRRMAERIDVKAVQQTDDLLHSWDQTHKRLQQLVNTPVTPNGNLSNLPTNFTDTQRKLRVWLEDVEQSLLNDKVQIVDLKAIEGKRKFYKNLLDQTLEQEHIMEQLNLQTRDIYLKSSIDTNRRLQEELNNYHDRLYDVKMFLSERLAKYNRLDKTLSEFERSVEEVKIWIHNVQPRLNTTDPSFTDSRALENQLGRNQILQHEIREMQTTINRLNKDVVDLTQDADESLARRLRDEMKELNENWSHIISSSKVHSQHIQDALQRNKHLHEEIQELEEWISEKEREAPADDGPIFYQDQLRERLDQYQKLQNEIHLKENTVRNLVLQGRKDLNTPSTASPDLAQSLETLVSNWTNLQKKVDTKAVFYMEIYSLHEDLKNILHQENVWLDSLQNKIFSSSNNGADAEEISEELDTLERFVKTHSKAGYDKIFEISDRLQATKVSLPATNSQINQFRIRWDQLHDDALKKIHTLNSQISDYQHMGHQITAMFEWMKHTDATLNARLKDDVVADDVPGEAEKFILEFNQYEAFLRSIDDKIHTLRSTGKNEAAKRLEQQVLLLRNQFSQLQTKFRHFQKPSDFELKHAKVRQILNDIEQHAQLLDTHSDDPNIIHNQLESCLKLYKSLSDIKAEVEYVIRTGRSIVEKRQVDEPNELTKQIDQLKTQYNNLGTKVSASKNQLDSIERLLRKFRKEYAHIHEWFVKADNELHKIENKHISKNTKEEIDWIRTTRNDIKKLETNFETLKNFERTIQREANRPLNTLQEKTNELKQQIDHLDRRLKDRFDVVEGQVRKLEDDYQRFIQVYQEIIIRLEKLENLLSDAERIVDLTRISQVQEELRSVRGQLDELLTLGQELVSKSEKYSKLVAPDIENITRKFEELQRRIRTIQETQEKRSREQQYQTTTINNAASNVQDEDLRRQVYTEKRYNRVQRESRHRSPSESSDVSAAHGVIDEEFKKKYLRCLAYMKLIERLYENQQESDEDSETVHRRLSRRDRTLRDRPEYEEIEKIIRETEERAYVIEKTDSNQASRIREKICRLRDCLDNLKYRSNQHPHNDEIIRLNERYEERVRTTDRREKEFDSDFIYDIDDTRSVLSESAPQFNTKYRKAIHSLERYRTDDQQQARAYPTQEEYHLQPLLRVRSLKAIDHHTLSAPSSPVLQPRYRSYERSNIQTKRQSSTHQGHQDNYQSSIAKSASLPNGGFPVQAPVLYRERVIDRHIAERSSSRGESHRQQQQESSGSYKARSAQGQTNTLNRTVPIRYETSNASSSSYRQNNGYKQHEQFPTYFSNNEQNHMGTTNSYRQQSYTAQNVGPHPTRIVN